MAYTTINKGSSYFNTVLYTGDGTTNQTKAITFGFQPDFAWFKARDAGQSHVWVDSVRGGTKALFSEAAVVENTLAVAQLFTSTGMIVSNDASANSLNSTGSTKVSWGWLANNTSGSSNTAGTITSTVAANTTSGFSIVKYTGNGTGNSTIGHGLSAVPKFIIVKSRTSADAWGTLSASFVSAADPNIVYLNNTAAEADDTNVWGTSANFTSSTFTVGTWNGSNANATDYIAYCWSEIKGYSKFGKYTGNGSADGTFVYTGFKPAFVMIRRTDSGDNWVIKDSVRDSYNVADKRIFANSSGAEDTSVNGTIDILSNGFKNRSSNDLLNFSGGTYIYMAFAEQPLVGTNNVPATAR